MSQIHRQFVHGYVKISNKKNTCDFITPRGCRQGPRSCRCSLSVAEFGQLAVAPGVEVFFVGAMMVQYPLHQASVSFSERQWCKYATNVETIGA